MKVIICGAGQVGWQIARHLSGERNDVTVVDNDPELIRRATNTLDVQGISGFASYPDILDRAGARDADMIIAATYSDEVNMVTCQVAHSIFSIPRKIARLRSQSYLNAIYSDLYRRDHLPIDVVISPEREVADAALKRMAAPAAFDTEMFLNKKAQLIALRLDDDCPVLNTPLKQLTDLFSTLRTIVVAVRREGSLFSPESGDQLFSGDECYLMCHVDDAYRSLISGKIESNTTTNTIADGLKTQLGDNNFPIILEEVKSIIRITEDEIIESMKLIWQHLKIICEPSCSLPLAGVIKNREQFLGKKIGIIITGGNVDLKNLPF